MAKFFGNSNIGLGSVRIRRCLYAFHGLPHTLLRIRIQKKSNRVSCFRGWARAWVNTQNDIKKHGASTELQEFYDGCTFKHAETKPWWNAFCDSRWIATDDILEFADKDCTTRSSSLSCGEQVHYMKKTHKDKGSTTGQETS